MAPSPSNLNTFLVEGSLCPADIGMATRCHPQLRLEVKAVQKEGKGLGGESGTSLGVGELGECLMLLMGAGVLLISAGRCSAKIHLSTFRILLPRLMANHSSTGSL